MEGSNNFMMRVMQIGSFGGPEVFSLSQKPKPELKPGHVLIKMKATSVNPLDFKIRSGVFPNWVTEFPAVLHGDISGIVESVSSDVTLFKEGDEVYGCIGGLLSLSGALADYVLADQELIAKKPKSLSFKEAAALPLVLETAWQGLFQKASLKPGQHLLVYGGTGGVGHIAALLGKIIGADVTVSTSSGEKAELIKKSLGIENIFNHKDTPMEDIIQQFAGGKGFDVVFDTVGGSNLNKAFEAVRQGGQVITILPYGEYNLGPLFLKNASLHAIFQPLPLATGVNKIQYHHLLSEAASLIDQHNIKPLIDTINFDFLQVAKAHQHLESGLAVGKVVIENSGT